MRELVDWLLDVLSFIKVLVLYPRETIERYSYEIIHAVEIEQNHASCYGMSVPVYRRWVWDGEPTWVVDERTTDPWIGLRFVYPTAPEAGAKVLFHGSQWECKVFLSRLGYPYDMDAD